MISDTEIKRFQNALDDADASRRRDDAAHGIGTLNEKILHRVLKFFFEPDETYHEIPCGDYVADIKRGNRITEIQTSGFFAVRDRLDFFLRSNEVTVVYPIHGRKKIVWVDPETGESRDPVPSPKKGRAIHVLPEIKRLGELFYNDALTVKCVILESTEYRMLDGWGSGGKRGAHRLERVPSALIDIVTVSDAEDIRALLPFSPGDTFDRRDFIKACGFPHAARRDIQLSLNLLEELDLTERFAKDKNRIIYRAK